MDGGGVDHDAEDAGVESEARHGDEVVVRRVRAHAQVGARGGSRAAQMREEALRHRDGLGRRVEDHRREVEQDPVEDDGQVGVGSRVQPQRGGAAAEVRQGLLVQLLRVVAAQLDADVAAAGRRGAGVATDLGRESRRTERADRDAVEGRAAEPGPDGVVGVALAEPSGLPQHRGGRLLPVGPRRRGSGQRERQGALVGLQLGGLGQAALDAVLRGHASHSRSGARPQPHAVTFLARAVGHPAPSRERTVSRTCGGGHVALAERWHEAASLAA